MCTGDMCVCSFGAIFACSRLTSDSTTLALLHCQRLQDARALFIPLKHLGEQLQRLLGQSFVGHVSSLRLIVRMQVWVTQKTQFATSSTMPGRRVPQTHTHHKATIMAHMPVRCAPYTLWITRNSAALEHK